jgi:hypothetical protein
LLVGLVVSCFFCPRFVIWYGLWVPEAWFNPEVNRAVDALRQLQNPFVTIYNSSNVVIQWRLFFPLLAHGLGFPYWLYLALPQIGCLLAVGYLIHIVRRHTGDGRLALLAAGALVSADWFFVSMGWLAYFDSWYVLGLLVAAFSPSRLALGVVCLVEPWIDERFILALPVCAAVRLLYDREWRHRSWRALSTEVGLMLLLTLPYVGVRAGLIFTRDAGSTLYLQNTVNELKTASGWRLAEGWWAGFRMAWVYGIAFAILVWRRQPGWVRLAALGAVGGVTFVALFIAGDISRNMAVALPALLLGVLMICSFYPRASRMVLGIVLLANLLLPATHVILSFKLPIHSVVHEMAEWWNPPACVNPVTYVDEGTKLLNQGDGPKAEHYFDNAVRLNPDLPEAWLGRGVAGLSRGDLAAALRDLNRALQLRPRWADALYFRGLARAKAGARDLAARDLADALECADRNWPRRQDCQSAREQLGSP